MLLKQIPDKMCPSGILPRPIMAFPNGTMLILTAIFVVCGMGSSCRAEKSVAPNLIVVVTDDQRWDTLGAMGNRVVHTPAMDELARSGVLFRNAYVTTSICCTSRASILSGQYASRHGIHDFATPFSPHALAETYPMQLKQAGYRVGFIGKYGVGNAGSVPDDQFDYWQAMAGQPRYEVKQPDGTIRHYTDIVSEYCREFLEGCDPNQPFCLSISFKAPHVQDSDPRQFIYNPRYRDLYRTIHIPEPPTGADEFFDRLPPCLSRNENEGRRRWNIRFSTPKLYQEMVKGYYRLITGVDDAMAHLRRDLAELGLAHNTAILLIGDNGFYLGEHGLAGKWYGHEESIRVPLILYDPRVPQLPNGRQRLEIALNIDVAPTLLDLAGLTPPAHMQGRSLVPFLHGAYVEDWRQEFYYEHRFPHPRIPQSEGIVGHRFKFLRYPDTDPIQEELYDLRNDPLEVHNLARQPDYADTLATMQKKCTEFFQTKSLPRN